MKYGVLLGRIFYALIFLMAGPGHFKAGTIAYAASQGVPMASILVPISGVLAILGGLSVMLGYKAKCGAGLLILFLVPVTLMMHRFWGLSDPMTAMIQQVMFMKNVSMLGGALIIMGLGSGPLSIKE